MPAHFSGISATWIRRSRDELARQFGSPRRTLDRFVSELSEFEYVRTRSGAILLDPDTRADAGMPARPDPLAKFYHPLLLKPVWRCHDATRTRNRLGFG